MNFPLIGLTGQKQSGKDTVAQYLVEKYGYQREAWADLLKLEVYHAFGKYILRDLNIHDSFFQWSKFIDQHKNDDPSSKYGWVRPILQFWGTEFRRKQDVQYWVKKLQHRLVPGVVVADCRFPNEIQAVHEAKGITVRIERLGYHGDEHSSEQLIKTLPVMWGLENTGALGDLYNEVDHFIDLLQMQEIAWKVPA